MVEKVGNRVTLAVNFDLLVLMIIIALMIIGYLSGALIEGIRLFQLVIPFLIIAVFGDALSRFILRGAFIQNLFSRYPLFTVIPYMHTFLVILIDVLIFVVIYYLLVIVLLPIRKMVASEIVRFKLGSFNQVFGSILACFRLYILLTLFILPFILMGFTSRDKDVTTRVVLSYTPRFIPTSRLVNQANELNRSVTGYAHLLFVLDLTSLSEYLEDMERDLSQKREALVQLSQKLKPTDDIPFGDSLALLSHFVTNPDPYFTHAPDGETKEQLMALYDQCVPLKGFIEWSKRHETPSLTREERMAAFVQDYDDIRTETSDSALRLKLLAFESKVIVYQWLTQTLGLTIGDIYQLYHDDTFTLVIDRLLIELDTGGLFERLKAVQDEEVLYAVQQAERFIHDYKELGVRDDIPHVSTLSPLYQMLAEQVIDDDWRTTTRSPLEAMYRIDTLIEINRKPLFFPDESFFQSLMKVYIPLYAFTYDEGGQVIPIDTEEMDRLLKTIERQINRIQLHDVFVRQLGDALVQSQIYDPEQKEFRPYIHYLVDEQMVTLDALEYLLSSSYLTESSRNLLRNQIEELRDADVG
ncbi:MAG TPA: hypothetical protein VIK63_07270 [Haloplasmataceae bacterium]